MTILDGPEVEKAEYNFTKLNIDEGHPSREWTDTFYFKDDSRILLRSSDHPRCRSTPWRPRPLPIRIVAPGRVYRKDEVDATHSPMFHQIEGMVIDKGVTMADLKGTLNARGRAAVRQGHRHPLPPAPLPLHRAELRDGRAVPQVRRQGLPHLQGRGLDRGAGRRHGAPQVCWTAGGIDPDVYSGWAFGMGLERLAMRQFKIADLRLIFENDVRFLEQF